VALPNPKAMADELRTKLEADASTSAVKWAREPIDPTEPTLKFPHGNVVGTGADARAQYIGNPVAWQSLVRISVAVFVQNQSPAVAEASLQDLAKEVERVVMQNESLAGQVLYVTGIGVDYDGIPKEGVHWVQFDIEYEARTTP
jgi:acetaldehyde dehydrogenase (acetylating)